MSFVSLLPYWRFERFDPGLQRLNRLCLSPIRLGQLFGKIHQPFEGNGQLVFARVDGINLPQHQRHDVLRVRHNPLASLCAPGA